MNEDLHIEKAAYLADKPGAENLATDRAREFVAKALASQAKEAPARNIFVCRPVYAWGGVALALAACVAAAIVLFRPAGKDGVIPGYGIPGTLLENQSIHATSVTQDSLATQSADSLAVETIFEPEE